jgi:type I restriction enzyme, R subunit
LAAQFGVRPLIFYSNGFVHWLWDDAQAAEGGSAHSLAYAPRLVQGFYKKAELELWRQRKTSKLDLVTTPIDHAIVQRPYQHRALRRINEEFQAKSVRKALLVMATGSGKTRTTIALVDQLLRANWAMRVLFLADRVALVKQAQKEFGKHLKSATTANLIERNDPKKNDHRSARICFSTYPTMINLIDEIDGGVRRFSPGHFDLVVIDEAHRSVYKKYRSIFAYFDSLLLGLTATPVSEVDRDTYALFDLEPGVPTDAYDLEEAIAEGFLVPPRAMSVPLRFVEHGIRYQDLSEEEQGAWDEAEWAGDLPAREIASSALNKVVFNSDTNDKVLQRLMQAGLKVAGGDRLGKTIIFAKNHEHAQFLQERFDENYPEYKGEFARVIDFYTERAQDLIDKFSILNSAPHIAISVDMLDTGIDVPEVLNLVIFKIVRSKTKFWQMIGRGTRLCKDLLGPGVDKTEFLVFDYCGNFEFFGQNPHMREAAAPQSLGARLFQQRVLIAGALEDLGAAEQNEHAQQLNAEIRSRLIDEVAGMNLNNFIVRMQREAVEHFQKRESWQQLSAEHREQLTTQIAGLPTALIDNELEAKQFDALVLGAELAVLRREAFARQRAQIIGLAAALEVKSARITAIRAELALILEVQSEEYWQDVSAWALEHMRRRLRSLIKLLDSTALNSVYTNFQDEIGAGTIINVPNIPIGVNRESFERKMRQFLRHHEIHITILKLRRGEQLTAQDLSELERMLRENGNVSDAEIAQTQEFGGLGLFIRSLIGMEPEAVQALFSEFLKQRTLNANQIQFIQLIVRHLTDQGAMAAARLYESPFTDLSDQGVGGLFDQESVRHIVQLLDSVRESAAA